MKAKTPDALLPATTPGTFWPEKPDPVHLSSFQIHLVHDTDKNMLSTQDVGQMQWTFTAMTTLGIEESSRCRQGCIFDLFSYFNLSITNTIKREQRRVLRMKFGQLL